MNAPLFFSNAGDQRGTPQALFDALHAEFAFTLDAAADETNHKCDLWFGPGGLALDALTEDWGGEGSVVFCNPPYSACKAFVAKAAEEAKKGATVVLLVPARTDTRWWQDMIWDASAWGGTQLDLVREIRRGERWLDEMPDQQPDGNWRPGVRGRFIPGRLSFELSVTIEQRVYVKEQVAIIFADTFPDTLRERHAYEALIAATGLPRMAIDGIVADKPDDELLGGAPFPSAIVIFEGA